MTDTLAPVTGQNRATLAALIALAEARLAEQTSPISHTEDAPCPPS